MGRAGKQVFTVSIGPLSYRGYYSTNNRETVYPVAVMMAPFHLGEPVARDSGFRWLDAGAPGPEEPPLLEMKNHHW